MEKKPLLAGSNKAPRPWTRPWRWAKTLFFVLTMLASLLLVCAPPLSVVVIDLLLPAGLLSVASSSSSSEGPSPFSVPAISSQLKSFDFGASLIDLPMMSAARSLLILCAYVASEGRHGLYLGFTALCSSLSMGYVLVKAAAVKAATASASSQGERRLLGVDSKDGVAVEALFMSSMALAIAHVVVAYRASCRERRKMLVYRIDIEAVKLRSPRKGEITA